MSQKGKKEGVRIVIIEWSLDGGWELIIYFFLLFYER